MEPGGFRPVRVQGSSRVRNRKAAGNRLCGRRLSRSYRAGDRCAGGSYHVALQTGEFHAGQAFQHTGADWKARAT
jgi:hypothetical protein